MDTKELKHLLDTPLVYRLIIGRALNMYNHLDVNLDVLGDDHIKIRSELNAKGYTVTNKIPAKEYAGRQIRIMW